MSADTLPLSGTTVAFLVAPEGIEQVELTEPWKAVEQAGGTCRLLSTAPGELWRARPEGSIRWC